MNSVFPPLVPCRTAGCESVIDDAAHVCGFCQRGTLPTNARSTRDIRLPRRVELPLAPVAGNPRLAHTTSLGRLGMPSTSDARRAVAEATARSDPAGSRTIDQRRPRV